MYFKSTLVLLFCIVIQGLAAPVEKVTSRPSTPSSAVGYLSRFGYLPSTNDKSKAALVTENGVKKALLRLQKFGGINETGELDNDTLDLIKIPRCGVKDLIETNEDLMYIGPNDEEEKNEDFMDNGPEKKEYKDEEEKTQDLMNDEEKEQNDGNKAKVRSYYPNRRRKRYALQGSRWKTKHLSYKIGKYPTKLSRNEVDSAVSEALGMWSDVSQLNFYQSSRHDVNIEIRFEEGNHGDGESFDGPGGVVAHAFFPEFGGDAHFDDDELWTINRFTGTSLLQSLTHELGHSLGLLHSSVSEAMMSPYHRGWDPHLKLHQDDIQAIQKLYGNNKVTSRNRNSNRRRG